MSSPDIAVELVAPLACEVGENPLWHPEANNLFFLDITKGTVHAYSAAMQNYFVAAQTRITGGFTLQRDGSLLLFQDGRIASLARDNVVREVACGLCPGNDRFNDVIADPEGRIFAGAMGGNGKRWSLIQPSIQPSNAAPACSRQSWPSTATAIGAF